MTLLERIEKRLAESGETASGFGRRVVRDPTIISNLRAGRARLGPRRIARLEAELAAPVVPVPRTRAAQPLDLAAVAQGYANGGDEFTIAAALGCHFNSVRKAFTQIRAALGPQAR